MKCYHPTLVNVEGAKVPFYVPCGRCAWCRKKLRDEWVFRLKQEKKMWNYSRFVTLTYDDDHLITHIHIDKSTGEMKEVPQVCKEHIQIMNKQIRKHGIKIKYLVSSEYGPENGRPHYHGIYFSDKPVNFVNEWNRGFVDDEPVSEARMKYVLKYMLKGCNVPEGSMDNFHLMSRRPGIGSNFVYKGEPYILGENGVKLVPGHYYRRNYLNSLDEKLRESEKVKSLDFLQGVLEPNAQLYQEYLEVSPVNMSFDDYKRYRYSIDLKNQLKIQKKSKL